VPDANANGAVTATGYSGYDTVPGRVAGIAELTIERAIERVGARVRSSAKNSDAAAISGISNSCVGQVLGPAKVVALLGDAMPIDAEVTAFSRIVLRWATDAGYADPGGYAEACAALVTATAKARLYDDSAPIPSAERFVFPRVPVG
jgi:hypothetical protein